MHKLKLSSYSKAEILKKIKLSSAIIPYLEIYKVNNYNNNLDKLYADINKKFKKKIAIRSSSYQEDQKMKTNAGKFKSFLNINSNNKSDVTKAIEQVLFSYKSKNNKDDEFFVQEMVCKPKISGVITTSDLNNSSPFACLNFQYGSDTSLVTSGRGFPNQIIFFKNLKKTKYKFVNQILRAIKEIEGILNNNNLDIEFAIDSKNKLNILQIRSLPITTNINYPTSDYEFALKKLEKKIIKLQHTVPNLYGKTSLFSVMSDWNPAEIIGKKPKPLAISLYKELITDEVWAQNRKSYGFNDVSSNELLVNFLGTPYVDLRVDFNSWIPKKLNSKLKKKLTEYYLNQLKNNPDFHDKIEFTIVVSCISHNALDKLKVMMGNGFSRAEINTIRKELISITNNAFKNIRNDYKLISNLESQQKKILNSSMYYIDKIYWLNQNCKKFGTFAFSGLARCGFIAIEILNSFVSKKIISEVDKENFLASINTITKDLIKDKNELTKRDFIKKYGHLRPNSYDITSKNYKEGYRYYFSKKNKITTKSSKFLFSRQQKKLIKVFLHDNNLKISLINFIRFLKDSVKYREEGKFIFMKSINSILDMIKYIGKRHRIIASNLQYVNFKTLLNSYNNLSSVSLKNLLIQEIKENKKIFEFQKKIYLPDFIRNKDNIYYNKNFKKNFNFIGSRNCTGEVIKINNLFKNININNKIVCIENADPGYDFIFEKKILGLITKYGGSNSHMAIRCSELKIPAVIGVGEKMFDQIINSKNISINNSLKKINIF